MYGHRYNYFTNSLLSGTHTQFLSVQHVPDHFVQHSLYSDRLSVNNACMYMIVMVTVTIYVLLALRLGTHLSKLAIFHIHMHNYDK